MGLDLAAGVKLAGGIHAGNCFDGREQILGEQCGCGLGGGGRECCDESGEFVLRIFEDVGGQVADGRVYACVVDGVGRGEQVVAGVVDDKFGGRERARVGAGAAVILRGGWILGLVGIAGRAGIWISGVVGWISGVVGGDSGIAGGISGIIGGISGIADRVEIIAGIQLIGTSGALIGDGTELHAGRANNRCAGVLDGVELLAGRALVGLDVVAAGGNREQACDCKQEPG